MEVIARVTEQDHYCSSHIFTCTGDQHTLSHRISWCIIYTSHVTSQWCLGICVGCWILNRLTPSLSSNILVITGITTMLADLNGVSAERPCRHTPQHGTTPDPVIFTSKNHVTAFKKMFHPTTVLYTLSLSQMAHVPGITFSLKIVDFAYNTSKSLAQTWLPSMLARILIYIYIYIFISFLYILCFWNRDIYGRHKGVTCMYIQRKSSYRIWPSVELASW